MEKPRYWTWARVNLNIFFNSVIEMYLDNASDEKISSRRFDNISSVRLDEREGTLVSPSNLSKATVNKREVNIHGNAELEKEQLEAVFKGFAEEKELKLRKLTLGGEGFIFDLRGISPDILAEVICRVDSVNLGDAIVGLNQAAAIFNSIVQCQDLKLRELVLWQNFERSEVSPEDFARAIIRLEEAILYSAEDDHISVLFTAIAQQSKESKLKRIYVEERDLMEISPMVFSQAILTLEEVDLGNSYVTPAQIKAVITSIVKAEIVRLRSLYVLPPPPFNFDIAPNAQDLLQAKKRVEKLEIWVAKNYVEKRQLL